MLVGAEKVTMVLPFLLTAPRIGTRSSRISNQSPGSAKLNKHMDNQSSPRYKTKAPSRGGVRVGAGRKKGSTPRYTLEELIDHIETHVGMSFAERVAVSYAGAINRADHAGVRDYEKILLGKMVADKQEITQIDPEEDLEARSRAFNEALQALADISLKNTKGK